MVMARELGAVIPTASCTSRPRQLSASRRLDARTRVAVLSGRSPGPRIERPRHFGPAHVAGKGTEASTEVKEIGRDWELETRPGLFTRLAVTLCIVLAAASGGTLLLRVLASIFAIFLACVRYIFISASLLFVLSLLWA